MTTNTTLAIIFHPRAIRAGQEFSDHQLLQALFSAAQSIKDRAGSLQTIGDPVVVLQAPLYRRASTIAWDGEGGPTVLDHMREVYGVTCAVGPCDTLTAEGDEAREIRDTLKRLLPPAEQESHTVIMAHAVASEVERLRMDVAHYREAAEGMTAMRVRELEERLMMEQNAGAHELGLAREALAAEESKTARLTAELATERGRVADLSTDAAEAALARACAESAAAVLDLNTPRAAGEYPHQVRVERPGGGIVRVIIAADVTDEIFAEVEAELIDRRLGIRVEREPGEAPEGWKVWEDEPGALADYEDDGSGPWMYGLAEDGNGPHGGRTTQMAAVDAAWECAVETDDIIGEAAADEA